MIRRPPRSTPLSLHDALPICFGVDRGADALDYGGDDAVPIGRDPIQYLPPRIRARFPPPGRCALLPISRPWLLGEAGAGSAHPEKHCGPLVTGLSALASPQTH